MSTTQDPIVFVAAKRTPQGRFNGKLANYTSLDLAVAAARAALGDTIPASAIDMTILGNVLPPVINVARQTSLKLGIPDACVSYTVNMACASGLHAITLGANAIQLGQAEVVLCGGTESMTNAPHILQGARAGLRLGDGKVIDTLLLGLSDPVIGETMTHTAERLAERFQISRQEQDEYALAGHQKAIAAQNSDRFAAELAVLPELDRDEQPRADTSLERLAKLKPVLGPEHTITAGNASGINDGAAVVVLCRLSTAERNGWKSLARLSGYTSVGCDPRVMGEGPVHAIRKLLARQNRALGDFDAIEINEAFAAQLLACGRQLGFDGCDSRLNRYGSGISLGHPIGASGARIAVHLAHRIAAGETTHGLASLCVGGGMGIAATIEAL